MAVQTLDVAMSRTQLQTFNIYIGDKHVVFVSLASRRSDVYELFGKT
jgi:hypothetical protein